jgi:amino acid transporter
MTLLLWSVMDHARRPSEPTSAQFIDIRRIPAQMFSNLVYNCFRCHFMHRCVGNPYSRRIIVTIGAVIAIIRLIVPWFLSFIGIPTIGQVINIILWAVVAIIVIYVVFALISCLLSLGGASPEACCHTDNGGTVEQIEPYPPAPPPICRGC